MELIDRRTWNRGTPSALDFGRKEIGTCMSDQDFVSYHHKTIPWIVNTSSTEFATAEEVTSHLGQVLRYHCRNGSYVFMESRDPKRPFLIFNTTIIDKMTFNYIYILLYPPSTPGRKYFCNTLTMFNLRTNPRIFKDLDIPQVPERELPPRIDLMVHAIANQGLRSVSIDPVLLGYKTIEQAKYDPWSLLDRDCSCWGRIEAKRLSSMIECSIENARHHSYTALSVWNADDNSVLIMVPLLDPTCFPHKVVGGLTLAHSSSEDMYRVRSICSGASAYRWGLLSCVKLPDWVLSAARNWLPDTQRVPCTPKREIGSGAA